jgi:hypothetical protein
MTTALSNLKTKISKKIKSLTLTKSNFDDDYLEKLFSSKNLKEIEASLSPKDLLELKKRIIIYRIKKFRNESAIKIQKMWNKYVNMLSIHKLAHHLTGCYTIYLESKGRTKVFIKIFCDESNKDVFHICSMRFCPIRKCFVLDIPKNKFFTQKKIMHFIFLNRKNESFYDDNYEKAFFFNECVHKVDFSVIDKNQKKLEEKKKKEKIKSENSKHSDINNLSTEDEKDNSESLTLTPTPENSIKFKFDVKNINTNEDDTDEYSGLRPAGSSDIKSFIRRQKRYESFDVSHSHLIKTKLKSILKDSNLDLLRQRRNKRESFKKVSFGKTETLIFQAN